MVVEGWNEIQLAIQAGHKAVTVFSYAEAAGENQKLFQSEIQTVSEEVFRKISYRDNPDGWVAIFPIPVKTLHELSLGKDPFLLIAESVEKPGNLGAILRTADAAGVDAVLVSDPRVDLYNPNVVRASRGTLFTVPTIEASNQDTLTFLRENKLRILAATPEAEAVYIDQDLRGPLAIVVGTEDKGLTGFWKQHADLKVKIPMSGKVNSLNVSIAAALIIFEAVRQRSFA